MIYSTIQATLKRILNKRVKLSKKKITMSERCHNCRQNINLESKNSSSRTNNKDVNNNAPKCSACIARTSMKIPGASDTFKKALAETENMEHMNNNRLSGNDAPQESPKNGLRKRFSNFKESSKNDFLGKISEFKDKFCESKKVDKHRRTVRWADEKKGVKLVTVHVIRPRLVFANQVSSTSPIMPRSILRVC